MITIHSDGFGSGTVVLDEDGNKLTNVKSATFNIDAQGVSEITLEISPVKAILQGNVAEVFAYCPMCSEHIEHVCQTSFGGGPLNTKWSSSLFNFEICGELYDGGICYVNKAVLHTVHFDAKTGNNWATI